MQLYGADARAGGTWIALTAEGESNLPSPVPGGGGGRAAVGGGQSGSSRPLHKTIQATTSSTERARDLRKNTTPPERVLWQHLRAKKLLGLKFRRQHPLGPYIADFYCHEVALVVEIDGNTHSGDQKRHDDERDVWMKDRNVRVIRIPAREIFSNIEGVVRTIEREARLQ